MNKGAEWDQSESIRTGRLAVCQALEDEIAKSTTSLRVYCDINPSYMSTSSGVRCSVLANKMTAMIKTHKYYKCSE